MRLLFVLLGLLVFVRSSGQLPVANFSINPGACRGEQLQLQNNSTGATDFEWDFCLQDIYFPSLPVINQTIGGLSWGTGYKLVEDHGNWYAFVTSFNNSSLIRLEFGDNPNNPPQITNLGNMGGKILLPFEIEIVFNNGQWYGFVGSFDISAGMVMLSFGNSLMNAPVASSMGSFGIVSRFIGAKAIKQGVDNILVLLAGDTRSILVLNFRDSYENTLLPADIFNTGAITLATNLRGFDLTNVNGNWIGLLTNVTTNEILKINFGTTLQTVPTTESAYTFAGLNFPAKVKIFRQGVSYYGFISGSDQLVTIDFDDLNLSAPQKINQPVFPVLYGLDVIYFKGKILMHGVSESDTNLRFLSFENMCSASFSFSDEEEPYGISYQTAGVKEIELRAYNLNHDYALFSEEITVDNKDAPVISLSSNGNICINNNIEFTSTVISGDVAIYNWDFGDTNTSMDPNPTHQYIATGDYEVSLQVTATAPNGCNNLVKETITIYNEPTPDFDLPAALPVCTNQPYLFSNTSSFDAGSDPTWQWEINGNIVSNDQHLIHSITSAIQQDVKLIASIPGCANEIIKTINTVEEGPLTNFTFSNECEDIAVAFTNTTTGTITGFAWDFGDGNASLQTNPSNIYNDFGVYDVSLEATNAAGCVNSIIKPITIYSKPQPDFSLDLPPFSCSGSPSQFNDLTPNPTDSNLESWTWTFGDPANGSSVTRNPQYIYTEDGTYDVNLEVTTNFGCFAAIEKSVNILPSPSADFDTSPACVNQPTFFTPVSTVGATSWRWNIGNNSYSVQNPSNTFNASLSYPVELIVTGANGCIAIQSRLISVPAVPVIDFTSENNCATQSTIFTDASSTVMDIPQTWQWKFDESGTGSGESTSYTFPVSGTYPTQLTVTYTSGCSYTTIKNVAIASAPVASFSATPESGTPPLTVLLTNNSASTISQTWSVAGDVISTDPSTQFVFDELGNYNVNLSVTNAAGCTDSENKMISVIVPTIDVELSSLTLLPADNGYYNILLVLLNKSNTVINNIEVKVDISGNAQLLEVITENIMPGMMLSKVLTAGIVLPKNPVAYVCAELYVAGDMEDSNNRNCETINKTVVLTASPNPTADQLTLDWVASSSGNAEVYIFDTSGHRVFQNNFLDFSVGLNHLTISLVNLNPGMYYLYFVSDNVRRTFPIVIRR